MAFAAETICVQGSNERKDPFGAISMPIYQNAAYAHPGLGKSTGYDYSRCSNPTRDEVQKTVALLEQGTEALAFSTGMAAIHRHPHRGKPRFSVRPHHVSLW